MTGSLTRVDKLELVVYLWAEFSWRGEKANISSWLEDLDSQSTGIPKDPKKIINSWEEEGLTILEFKEGG